MGYTYQQDVKILYSLESWKEACTTEAVQNCTSKIYSRKTGDFGGPVYSEKSTNYRYNLDKPKWLYQRFNY